MGDVHVFDYPVKSEVAIQGQHIIVQSSHLRKSSKPEQLFVTSIFNKAIFKNGRKWSVSNI